MTPAMALAQPETCDPKILLGPGQSDSVSPDFVRNRILGAATAVDIGFAVEAISKGQREKTVLVNHDDLNLLESTLGPKLNDLFPNTLVALPLLFARARYTPSSHFLREFEKAFIAGTEHFDTRMLVLLLHNLGQMDHRASESFYKAWEQAALSKLKIFNSRDLATAILAFSRVRQWPGPEFRAAFQKAAIARISDFNPQDLSTLIFSFGQMGHKPTPELLRAWHRQASLRIGEFAPVDLANSLFGIVELQLSPGQEFMAAWEKRALATMNQFKPVDLTNSMKSLGRMGHKPSRAYLSAWESQVLTRVKEFRAIDFVQGIFGLYLAGELSITPQLAAHIRRQSLSGYNAKSAAQLGQAYLYWKKVGHLEITELEVFAIALQTFDPSDRETELERKTRAFIESNGFSVVSEYRTEPGFVVDFFAEKENAVIQADGPLHYWHDFEGRELPSTGDLRIDEILKAYGYKVLRIKYTQVPGYRQGERP